MATHQQAGPGSQLMVLGGYKVPGLNSGLDTCKTHHSRGEAEFLRPGWRPTPITSSPTIPQTDTQAASLPRLCREESQFYAPASGMLRERFLEVLE